MDKIDLLIDKLEHMITVIPDNHSLIDCLKSHIRSLYYCAPEILDYRIVLIAESLGYFLGEVNNKEWEDWHKKAYEIWMNKGELINE